MRARSGIDRDWMRPTERERPRAWARRVVETLTRTECAGIVDALDPAVLRGDDNSTTALRRKRTMRPVMSIADDLAQRAAVAKLEQPFGKRAA